MTSVHTSPFDPDPATAAVRAVAGTREPPHEPAHKLDLGFLGITELIGRIMDHVVLVHGVWHINGCSMRDLPNEPRRHTKPVMLSGLP